MSAHIHYPPATVEDVIDEDASPALYPLMGDDGPLLYEVQHQQEVSGQHHILCATMVAE